jgi:hypothetical protein
VACTFPDVLLLIYIPLVNDAHAPTGFNDNPIARRVRHLPDDYFLLTNRFLCDSKRTNLPGCGQHFQGTDPHIIAQLPRYVQEAFPGTYLSDLMNAY